MVITLDEARLSHVRDQEVDDNGDGNDVSKKKLQFNEQEEVEEKVTSYDDDDDDDDNNDNSNSNNDEDDGDDDDGEEVYGTSSYRSLRPDQLHTQLVQPRYLQSLPLVRIVTSIFDAWREKGEQDVMMTRADFHDALVEVGGPSLIRNGWIGMLGL